MGKGSQGRTQSACLTKDDVIKGAMTGPTDAGLFFFWQHGMKAELHHTKCC